jgi:hypothetical protein
VLRDELRRLLSREGHEVSEAGSIVDAERALEAQRTNASGDNVATATHRP